MGMVNETCPLLRSLSQSTIGGLIIRTLLFMLVELNDHNLISHDRIIHIRTGMLILQKFE